jgi:hypothetical protein
MSLTDPLVAFFLATSACIDIRPIALCQGSAGDRVGHPMNCGPARLHHLECYGLAQSSLSEMSQFYYFYD